jgi:hypothetical protein
MSDELAQDEADAEDYDLESLERRDQVHVPEDDDDAATLVGGRRPTAPVDDRVVFEIGDEHGSDDEDEADHNKSWSGAGTQEDRAEGGAHERQGLMGGPNSRKDD